MVEKNRNFLGKDISIHRRNDKPIRGLCVNQMNDGLMINPKNDNYTFSDKFVWIPFSEITEIYFEEGGEKNG